MKKFQIFLFFYRKLKIGYYLSDGKFSPHPGCTRAVKEAVVTLRNMGHTVVEVKSFFFNMFVTSKIEFSISPILQFLNLKCCIKAKEPFQTPYQ